MKKIKKYSVKLFLLGFIIFSVAIFADTAIPAPAAQAKPAEEISASADDTGFEIPFNEYVDQEAKAMAQNYGHTLCDNPNYYCRSVAQGETWSSLFPDFQQREIVKRLNRTNLALGYLKQIVIPKDFSKITYMSISPLPAHMATHHKKLLYVNLTLFAFGAYDANGNLIYWGPVSSGANRCPANDKSCTTVTGSFKIFRMEGADCTSNEFPLETHGGAPMPNCLFFHGGSAVHGSTLSGFINRSAGCVRLFYSDAEWLYDRFAEKNMRIIITK